MRNIESRGTAVAMAREQEPQTLLNQAYEKASIILKNEAIRMEKYKGVFGNKALVEDKLMARKLQQEFEVNSTEQEKEDKKLATILEAIIYDQANRNQWFGEGVRTLRPSLYDDIVNGVDCIAEYEEATGPRYLAIAIDATSGHPGRKFNAVKTDLDKGRLRNIKYSPGSQGGRHAEAPAVIIGMTRGNLEQLMQFWINDDQKQLSSHPAQRLLLEQMVAQLQTYRDILLAHHFKIKSELISAYLNIIQPILEKKQQNISLGELEHDQVDANIKAQLGSMRRANRLDGFAILTKNETKAYT